MNIWGQSPTVRLHATARGVVVMVLLFTVGITVCFIAAMVGQSSSGMSMSPAFFPDSDALRQVVYIAFVSPWAFIGFETVSHSAAEYQFKHSNLFRILIAAVVTTTALYIFPLRIAPMLILPPGT